jgi:hypothetical protein
MKENDNFPQKTVKMKDKIQTGAMGRSDTHHATGWQSKL